MDKVIFTEKLNKALKENANITLTEKQQEQMFLLTERLVEVNKVMNLTAITDEDGIILRHLVDSLLISEYFEPNSTVIDVGCGAGFPSLPLAIVRPDLKITALDSTEKRIRYVSDTANILDLPNVTAVAARAEEFANLPNHRENYDYATARAVASLPMLCELTIPFIKVGGKLVAMKAKGAHEEFEASRSAIRQLAGANSLAETKLYESSLVGCINGEEISENRTVVVMNKLSSTSKRFPRKFAQIKKSPL
ncbi:MAG: 16S rRNA (guanine(527)-N(7))-methyltransferase RsmG [Clostridia bacterium]|nr:16S rRNA (guanine(527)-N(7))-methyltransferase RsmG [Clostridia bacterium]